MNSLKLEIAPKVFVGDDIKYWLFSHVYDAFNTIVPCEDIERFVNIYRYHGELDNE